LETLSLYGRIILKLIIKKYYSRVWIGIITHRIGSSAGIM